MKKILHQVLLLSSILFLLNSSNVSSQTNCFETLQDISGVIKTGYEQTLETAACNVKDVIELEEGSTSTFKVFDFGFYAHHKQFVGSTPEMFQKAIIDADAVTSQYLLMGREYDKDGGKPTLWLKFKYPTANLDCLDSDHLASVLQSIANSFIQEGSNSNAVLFQAEELVLKELENRLFEGFCCSNYSGLKEEELNRSNSTTCLDFNAVNQAKTILLGDLYFIEMIDIILALKKVYDQCNSSDWQPMQEKRGIVPKCLYIGMNENLRYTPADLAFTAGLVDGFYSVYLDVKAIEDFAMNSDKHLLDLIYSYTLSYLICYEIELTKTEFRALMESIFTDPTAPNTVWQSIHIGLFTEAYGAFLLASKVGENIFAYFYGNENKVKYCKKWENIRDMVSTFVTFVAPFALMPVTPQIIEQQYNSHQAILYELWNGVKTIWNNIDGFGNEDRFWQGYYMVRGAFLLFPFKGQFFKNIPVMLTKLKDHGIGILSKVKNYVKLGMYPRLIQAIKIELSLTDDIARELSKDFKGNYGVLYNLHTKGQTKGWKIIYGLDRSIRKKGLNIELASKLDDLGLHSNTSETHKRIRKIVKNLDAGKTKGTHVTNRINSGELDEIIDLNKVLNKLSADPNYLNAAKQAIDKADELVAGGIPKNRILFEDEVIGPDGVGVYDVDVGIKSVNGTPLYEKGFQLKSVETPNAAKNNLGSHKVTQIINSPCSIKIYEIEMRSGSFAELENIQQFWTNLNETKTVFPNLQIQIKDVNGVINPY